MDTIARLAQPQHDPLRPHGHTGFRQHRLDTWREPEEVLLALREDHDSEDVVWVDAGHGATTGISILGWGTRRIQASISDAAGLRAALTTLATRPYVNGCGHLGWFGWIGYGLAATTLHASFSSLGQRLTDRHHSDLAFLHVDRALVFDHSSRSVSLQFMRIDKHWLARVSTLWSSTCEAETSEPTTAVRTDEAVWTYSDSEYLNLIRCCQQDIATGEAFVLCLTMTATVAGITEDPLTVYRRLRRQSPAPHATFLQIDGTVVLSASPERFVTIDRHGMIVSSPIKGTRPRSAQASEDRQLADELSASEKERAENVMIVDLVRNDFGRVCRTGSVRVAELLAVHSFRHVHQLQSTVTGLLRDDVTPLEAVLACFPPGSMTGAPKRRAVELLASRETHPRGIYSGVVGRIGLDGALELAVVIRTIVIKEAIARVGAGGGITSDSHPPSELIEVKTKAAALLAALGSR